MSLPQSGHAPLLALPQVDDAVDDPRWNSSMDTSTGFHTHNILTYPVKDEEGRVVAVMQVTAKCHLCVATPS